jgi:hypothetical protein
MGKNICILLALAAAILIVPSCEQKQAADASRVSQAKKDLTPQTAAPVKIKVKIEENTEPKDRTDMQADDNSDLTNPATDDDSDWTSPAYDRESDNQPDSKWAGRKPAASEVGRRGRKRMAEKDRDAYELAADRALRMAIAYKEEFPDDVEDQIKKFQYVIDNYPAAKTAAAEAQWYIEQCKKELEDTGKR